MSVIDYTSLEKIAEPTCSEFDLPNQELLQLSMTQPYQSDQCGAFALVAAATTLKKLPANKTLMVISPATKKEVRVDLSTSDTFNKLACKIYQLTGNLSTNPEEGFVEKNGYNNPVSLIEVAYELGLNAKLVLTKDGDYKFKETYPKVYESCKEFLKEFLNDEIHVIDESEVTNPNKDQIGIALMKTFNKSYHWIAKSSDNTYFDSLRNFYPGNQYGRVGAVWPSRPYIDFGLIILLSK